MASYQNLGCRLWKGSIITVIWMLYFTKDLLGKIASVQKEMRIYATIHSSIKVFVSISFHDLGNFIPNVVVWIKCFIYDSVLVQLSKLALFYVAEISCMKTRGERTFMYTLNSFLVHVLVLIMICSHHISSQICLLFFFFVNGLFYISWGFI